LDLRQHHLWGGGVDPWIILDGSKLRDSGINRPYCPASSVERLMELRILPVPHPELGCDDVCEICESTSEFCWRDIWPGWGPNCAKLAEYLNDEYGINRGRCEWGGEDGQTLEELASILLIAIEKSGRIVP